MSVESVKMSRACDCSYCSTLRCLLLRCSEALESPRATLRQEDVAIVAAGMIREIKLGAMCRRVQEGPVANDQL